MNEEQLSPELEIISNQELRDEERRSDDTIQALDITNMDTIVLEPIIGGNRDIFEQTVGQVNLSRGPTITNYVNFDLDVPENSRGFILTEGPSATEYANLDDRTLGRFGQRVTITVIRTSDYILHNRRLPVMLRQNTIARRIENVPKSVDDYLFDIDKKEQENLTSDIICSICLTSSIKPTEPTKPEVSNDDDESNLTNNKFCHLSCTNTHKFHSQCIKTWLKKNLTCPCCRAIPEKNNLISLASEKIKHVNSPRIYTDDPIIEQLRANGSRYITRLREIS